MTHPLCIAHQSTKRKSDRETHGETQSFYEFCKLSPAPRTPLLPLQTKTNIPVKLKDQ